LWPALVGKVLKGLDGARHSVDAILGRDIVIRNERRRRWRARGQMSGPQDESFDQWTKPSGQHRWSEITTRARSIERLGQVVAQLPETPLPGRGLTDALIR
jgi:hypothetical protein